MCIWPNQYQTWIEIKGAEWKRRYNTWGIVLLSLLSQGAFSLQTNLKESSISSSLFDFRSDKICEPVNFDAKLSVLFGDNH